VPQTVFSLSYNFNLGVADNGNVAGIINNRDNTRSESFSYDGLNRLVSAQTSASSLWGDAYVYDLWGNLLQKNVTQGTAENLTVIANASNRFTGYSYDASGNLLNDGVGHAFTFDAETRITTTAGVNYTYDGDGNRVEKSSGTLYWGSGSLAESDLSGNVQREFVFFAGKRIARLDLSSGGVHYYLADHLGTAAVVVNSSGGIENESDYYPWGGERIITQSLTNQNYNFTGKERDSESNNDYFGARYYSPVLSRFVTADWSAVPAPVPYSDLGNPQSLNLYSLVRDNPSTLADVDGHQSPGALTGSEAGYLIPRMGGGSACALGMNCATSIVTGYELTVDGQGSGIYFATVGQAETGLHLAQAFDKIWNAYPS
jgi:RHS repeat-associated protein